MKIKKLRHFLSSMYRTDYYEQPVREKEEGGCENELHGELRQREKFGGFLRRYQIR